jgi:ATPase subunit of ABC transporter with duplicated ATPase domains
MITTTDLTMEFGGQTLFVEANLQFDKGKRYGVVGANGSGKSTLLKIVSGEVTPSSGDVNLPRRARLGILEQNHFQYEDVRIIDVVMMGHEELWSAMQKKEELLSGEGEDFDVDVYSKIEETIMRLNGYALESTAAEILAGLQIPSEVIDEPLSILSGGYKLRALLAKVLASEPDILFLDEPNNHLDILSLRWLEKFLINYRGCAVIVSHDHRFLDNVATHIVDVDYQRVAIYKGNYSKFVAAKAATRDLKEREIQKREKEIEEQQAFIRRFKAKATKARQAKSKQKRVEKLVIEKLAPSSRRHPKFKFPQVRPSGRKVLEAMGINKAYDDNVVLKDVDLTVMRGDRVAIIGPNGIGKSTLLKVLQDLVPADDGLVEWGHETHLGYFAQDHHDTLVDGDATPHSWLWSQAPGAAVGNIYSHLAQVLFDRDDTDKKISNLSGGEAARLVLAGLTIRRPNVLLLDEPTNHLDLEGIEALANALKEAEGTVIFVSHDRWFVQHVATRIFEIRRDGVTDFNGTYDEYLAHCTTDHLDRAKVVQQAAADKRAAKKAKK